MSTITPGTVVTFGRYIQYDNTYAATPIEWIVLDTDGHTAKLISRYGLEIMTYHDEQSEVSWENCALRTWWLQSSGGSQGCAPVVIENGDILYEGWSVGSRYLEVAVRPVIALRVT